jgi:hypothetical protein
MSKGPKGEKRPADVIATTQSPSWTTYGIGSPIASN